MNQIQEKDWAEESWHGHTGIDSSCDYCIIDETIGEPPKDPSDAAAGGKGMDRGVENPENDHP